MDNSPLQVKNFNNKVRAMNQSNAKTLTLNAQEAQNLQAEIYDLLATIAGLVQQSSNGPAIASINMDGGGFK